MTNHDKNTAAQISRLDKATRLNRLAEIGRTHGYFRRISAQHSALFVEEGDTLLVSFDAIDRVINHGAGGLPMGFHAVKEDQVSLLSILAKRQSWFRDGALFDYVDALVDDGFFDQFEQVLFLGIGPMCGYGALSFSVAAPSARVLAISPAATLDRDAAPFERRYRGAWRLNFTDRYGYAPDMVEAAAQATIIYDPSDPMSASHAALFDGANTTRLKLRFGGMSIGAMLEASGGLWTLLERAWTGPITPAAFARVARPARRSFPPYLGRLISQADQTGHPRLARAAAEYGQKLGDDPRFKQAAGMLRSRAGGLS
ncbi:MAG: phosphoadenosine phosphosulfate reductase [Pseudomonadota bacterium]